jgi:ATP-dependent helicase/nuclease subunit A
MDNSSPRAIAEFNQGLASDPAVSAFVSASAGSGKTKLLTDRLLRLMLAGADPARIQCLTYTRAGAAEMRGRLQKKLGAWVTHTDAALDAELAALALTPDAALRARARRLFATVLDLPGGMRIETIHAFCSSLLRRFPLEAAISPHFELLDDLAAWPLQHAARDAALADAPAHAVDVLTPQLDLEGFGAVLAGLRRHSEKTAAAMNLGLQELRRAQCRVLGVDPDADDDTVLRAAVHALDLPRLRILMRRVAEHATATQTPRVSRALDWLAQAPPEKLTDWHEWAAYFFTKAGEKCAERTLVSASAKRAYPGIETALTMEQDRVCAVLETLRAVQVARLSVALMHLAAPAIRHYEQRKTDSGWLDYQDLIAHARRLLHEPGAAWVLYKLDGGLDHLLLDEVQDTAPDQWLIANALTGEFFAGAGARDDLPVPRSIFAVGDHKQSIFAFQGAEPREFDRWRQHMEKRVTQSGRGWRFVPLEVSFRSTQPVLTLVDTVFAQPGIDLGVELHAALHHIADRADHAGRVELWPPAPRPEKPEAEHWSIPEPDSAPPTLSGPELLAARVAEWIAGQLRDGAMLESQGRALHAGDFLVLVRKRGAFDQALLKNLKDRHVPVAGLDRMTLTEQPAVADILALCDALLLPEDDLSLAIALTSPLGFLSDDSLMRLSLGRAGTLWETLRRRAGEQPDWQAAHDFLHHLFARVDFATPHALLAEILGPLGGRARIFARLGAQSAEAIDELLSTARGYADRFVPSLQGFLHWLLQSGAEVKREAESTARELRIMTVHGAKGLQAPIVILPASFGLSASRNELIWLEDPGTGIDIPVWGPRQDTYAAAMHEGRARIADAARQEHYRLLYVALTRAEDRLVICGWTPGKSQDNSWYDCLRTAFEALSPRQEKCPFWDGDILIHETPQSAAVAQAESAQRAETPALPGWAGAADRWRPEPPPAEPARPADLAPSRPDNAMLGQVPVAASPLALRDATGRRFRRGTLLHSLLQHLPAQPVSNRAAAAHAYLRRQLPPAEAETLAREALALLDDPALAPLFAEGSRAEVPLTGIIDTPDGPAVVGGMVDRLAICPDAVLIADYKTNREPPDEIPMLYRRQMESYQAVLRLLYPDRPVRCALIWTRTGRVDWVTAPEEAV